MTKQPHNPQNAPGGNPLQKTTAPEPESIPAPRKQRVRGCGVPANVWFTPHPDSYHHDARKAEAGHTQAPTANESDSHYRAWAMAETIRQFTAAGQHYAIVRAPLDGDGRTPDGTIIRRRRTTAEGDPKADTETTIRADYNLVIITGSDREFPDDEDAQDDDFAYDERPEPQDRIAVALDPLAVLIKGAKRMLGDGGVLAVQLPRPAPGHGFSDGTGAVIADARRAGFSYLQHIALVDSFIDHDGLTPVIPKADLDAFWAARSQGLTVHARAHTDLMIFRKIGKETTLA